MGTCGSETFEKQDEDKKPPMKINQLSETDQAMMKCKQCRDNIKVYIKRLEKTAANKREKAKEVLKNKDKDRAKIYLKQSKFHSEQIKVASKQLEMVEEQISSIETASQLSEVMKVLKNGNEVLKKIQDEIKVEKWEAISEDMNEIKEQQDEIGEFLKQYNVDQTEYDNNVNAELEKLEKDLGLESKDNLKFPEAVKTDVNKKEEIKQEIKKEKKVAIEA